MALKRTSLKKIKLTAIYVSDQDKALRFYTWAPNTVVSRGTGFAHRLR
jgi:catechol 2,3-dioxygenase-like lactoylglutathione lyase family enzyme